MALKKLRFRGYVKETARVYGENLPERAVTKLPAPGKRKRHEMYIFVSSSVFRFNALAPPQFNISYSYAMRTWQIECGDIKCGKASSTGTFTGVIPFFSTMY